MIFLFAEIDHPDLVPQLGTPEADHIRACQYFLIEETLFANGVEWMKRTPSGVQSIFNGGDAAKAAIALHREFHGTLWKGFEKARIRIVLHAGEADPVGQNYTGPDLQHALALLDAAWGGQILLSVAAVHFVPLPPGGRLKDLGTHFLKDLTEPATVYSLQHPDLENPDHPPLKSLETYPQNLPVQATPFLGREEEMREITDFLSGSPSRLITLIGPGGFGKTRLGLRSSAAVVEKFKDGVYLVALAPLLSDDLIVGSIGNVIKFLFSGPEDPKTQLFNHLKDKTMLLVMDNFEHIIEGAELVREMLQAAPGLKILATSREKLGVEGERIFEVRGLRYPQDPNSPELESSSAVQLFLKSARKIKPHFALHSEDREPLLTICRLLEGMPLGLEISATWAATLPLSEIAEKIENSRDFLATTMPHLPPRHRSLRGVFEYSWILLSEEQKKVLKAIAIFKGGFSGEAAWKIAGVTEKTLGQLQNKSLIRARSDGRFEIHELLKYYAKEKLFDDPVEKEKVMNAHSAYFAGLLYSRYKGLFGPARKSIMSVLALEMDNIKEGWKRAVDRADEELIGKYLDGLYSLYSPKGRFQEGADAFQKALESIREKKRNSPGWPSSAKLLEARLLCYWAEFEKDLGEIPKAAHLYRESLDLFKAAKAEHWSGQAQVGMGVVYEIQGDNRAAQEYSEKGLKFFQKAGNKWGIAWATNQLGHLLSKQGHFQEAIKVLKKSLALSESRRDEDEMAFSENLLGDALHELCNYEEARQYHQKGLSHYLESADRKGVAWSFINLGRDAWALGDYPGARQMYQEGMAISREVGDIRAIGWCDVLTGFVAWAQGDYDQAERLYEEGLFFYQRVGDRRGEGWALEMLGNLKVAQRKDKEAEESYQKALDLLEREGLNEQNKAWHLFHLGTVSLIRENLTEAGDRFGNSLKIFQKSGDALGKSATLIQLGELDTLKGEFHSARKRFEEAARLSLKYHFTAFFVDLMAGVAGLCKAEGDERKAIGLFMVALNHPTCRRQTKDRMVSLGMELKSHFSAEETEGYVQWAKTSDIREVILVWLQSLKTEGRAKKAPAKRPKRKAAPRAKGKKRKKRK